MLTILLHSSKTMQSVTKSNSPGGSQPLLLRQALELAEFLKDLNQTDIQKAMALSPAKAAETYALIQNYSETNPTLPAIDIFLGDIYSGLQTASLTAADRAYAHQHLYILSGLYGILRALDEIQPYRLEMGYTLPSKGDSLPMKLYDFWGDAIARQLPKNQTIINLSAVEYTKAVFPHLRTIAGLKEVKIITPKFLTVSPKTGAPTFVTVHAKIARGAYARWLIQHRIGDAAQLQDFNEIGYTYNAELSTPEEPVFVATQFGGLGLSVRLSIDRSS